MSIPLDRLYNFLSDQATRDMLIYRWYPHGSKKPEDLQPLTDYKQQGNRFGATNPIMICHDQEPLNHALYDVAAMKQLVKWRWRNSQSRHWIGPLWEEMSHWNLRARVELYNVYDQVLLLHSEKNSSEVDWYRQHDFVPVYYWCHALIARDWFRYAEHDPILDREREPTHAFLIYNRAWSGTREYRLTFAQGLVDRKLIDHCKTTFAAFCDDTHYQLHRFANPGLCVTRHDLESHFDANTATASASADYDSSDYASSMIEVVLETLFDDTRWHLTEKSLRPIACGMPFILASTAGSLAYLRSYGFRTFSPWINESYDGISDPGTRLAAIQQEMRRIADLPLDQRRRLHEQLQQIARYNRRYFFSDDFYSAVIGEYKHNLDQGLAVMEQNRRGNHLLKIKTLLESLPNRPRASADRFDQLYDLITKWNCDPSSVPENW